MVTVLITSFLLLAVISFAIYFWQRTAPSDNRNQSLPPPPDFDGLFADAISKEQLRLDTAQQESKLAEQRNALLVRAGEGDKSTLGEAARIGGAKLYDEVLNTLVGRAENEKQVLALASYLSRNDGLPVNSALAKAFTQVWTDSPDRQTTAKVLHVVALAGDAALFHQTIGLVLQYWHAQRLQDISLEELVSLIESEFWLIPQSARDSGAGFLLKRELARIRRELAATAKT